MSMISEEFSILLDVLKNEANLQGAVGTEISIYFSDILDRIIEQIEIRLEKRSNNYSLENLYNELIPFANLNIPEKYPEIDEIKHLILKLEKKLI